MKKVLVWGMLTLLLSCGLSLLPKSAQAQCTMCKTQVEASRTEKTGYDTSGLNKGIVYLMTIPYLLIGTVGFFWYRNAQKKKQSQR